MNIAQLAHAFASGSPNGSCHNARVTPGEYRLHGHLIAKVNYETGEVVGDWCGHYTKTTASHLNAIIKALRQQSALKVCANVGYANARDNSTEKFVIATKN